MDSDRRHWNDRLADLWASLDQLQASEFVAKIDELAAELGSLDPIADFERACARDSTGDPQAAIPLYLAALNKGLAGIARRRAVIQMSSSLRNLGQAQEAVERLTRELEEPADELEPAVHAFLALALADLGQERKALALSLTALSGYLPRYNRSLARYASELGNGSVEAPGPVPAPDAGSPPGDR